MGPSSFLTPVTCSHRRCQRRRQLSVAGVVGLIESAHTGVSLSGHAIHTELYVLSSWRKKMRKWGVVLVMGLFIALPAVAQEKTSDANGTGITSTATAESAPAPAPTRSEAATIAPASSNIFAFPVPPRAPPFPAPSASLASSE